VDGENREDDRETGDSGDEEEDDDEDDGNDDGAAPDASFVVEPCIESKTTYSP
jgi:hypothetical protein